VPRTKLLSDWCEWSRPSIVKSRYSIMESDQALFYGGVKLVQLGDRPDVDSMTRLMKAEPIVQEYIDGPEYGFFALYNKGKLKAKFQHRRTLSFSYQGGVSACRQAVRIKALDELGTKILGSLNWHGPAMVECKFDQKEKKFKLIEINPRFWGSLPLAIQAGVDFPYLDYLIARDGDCLQSLVYSDNVSSFYEMGVLVHFFHLFTNREPSYVARPRLSSDIGYAARLLMKSRPDVMDRRDPQPFLGDFLAVTHRG